jgi:PAS domain S-box-containing protein
VATGDHAGSSGGKVRIATALAAFVVLALTVAFVSFAYYRTSTNASKRQAFDSLQSIAHLKTDSLGQWVRDRYADGEAVTRDTALGARVAALARGGSATTFAQAEGAHLDAIGRAGGFATVAVLDAAGNVLWHSGPSLPPIGSPIRQLVGRAASGGKTLWSDLYLDPGAMPMLDFIAPLNAPRAPGVASHFAVLLRIDPSSYLFPFIQTWPGNSRSAETLLVRRAGDQVVYLNELRFRRGTALRFHLAAGSASLPAAQAVDRGGAGVIGGQDYRGVNVLAAYRAVPGTDWHLIAKVDSSELLAGRQSLFGTLLLTSLAVVLAAGLGTILVWRSREVKLVSASAALDRERLAFAERYRLLLHNAGDIVLILDQNLRVIEANESALQTYGYSQDELLGVSAMALRGGEELPANVEWAERLQRDGQEVAPGWHFRKDGGRFPVQTNVGSVQLDGRRIYVDIVHDLTERAKLETELRRLNTELEQRVRDRTAELQSTNDELEAFAYSVSHDLRAPLRHVNGYADLLEKRYGDALDEQAHHYMVTISKSAQAMGTLIDDLLQFSHSGRTELKLARIDMGELVREVQESLQASHADRDIEWRVEPLPVVWGDKALLRQVWYNLLENAIKFTRPREKAQIAVEARATDDEQQFSVKDNGVGFDMRYADKLFGVFQRLHRSDEFEGTGIGLANVHRIVTRLGGHTRGEAVPDEGAVFGFSLPKRRGGVS